uniref:Uncharacterized protein n=1 Tax=Lotharella oceanica TaxID=641309 RepID=A0A7S2X828_9EUKA|mmetsp:Transcript_16687/g.31652  ORF Transcript_16687/g.31652 Transcript_16687/m.31652 type:complete len:134 (+) Transcript_16687:30-431(+)
MSSEEPTVPTSRADKVEGKRGETSSRGRRPRLTLEVKVDKTNEPKTKEVLSPTGVPYSPKERDAAAKIQKFYRRRRSRVNKILSPNSVKLKTKLRRGESAPSRPQRIVPKSTQSLSCLSQIMEKTLDETVHEE